MNPVNTTSDNTWVDAEAEASEAAAKAVKIERETHKLETFEDCEVAIRMETGQW